jgi:hypothetical protein
MSRHHAHGCDDAFLKGTLALVSRSAKALAAMTASMSSRHLKVVCSHWQLSRHSGMNQLSLGRTKQRISASGV